MKTIKNLLLLLTAIFFITSCDEREYDVPPINYQQFTGKANITIKDFLEKYNSVTDTMLVVQKDTIEGYVTSTDISGNIFKQMVIQDETAALVIDINQSNMYADYPLGQKVIVECDSFYVGRTYKMFQMGGFYKSGNYNQVGRIEWLIAKGKIHKSEKPDPTVIKPDTITVDNFSELSKEENVGKLYFLKGVVFQDGGQKTFATDAESSSSGGSTDRVVYFNGNSSYTVTTRNSTYADFATNTVPSGTGNLLGILTHYNGSPQFLLRTYDDVQDFSEVGSGTKDSPWNIEYALDNQTAELQGWVQGYIVGAVKAGVTTVSGNSDIDWVAPFEMDNTVLIAADANEKDYSKCLVVNLPAGVMRNDVNLKDNTGNLGKLLKVNGKLQSYMGTAGLVTNGAATDYVLDIDASDSGSETIFNETFGTTAVQNGTAWPSVSEYTGYNKTGAGAAQVTYSTEGTVTIRTNSPSSGYTGASGSCNAMMAASGASLIINDIATCGATNLYLSFGSNETNTTLSVTYKINGTSQWIPISYGKTTSSWGLVSSRINLPAGANTIKLKFTAIATQYGTRVDDITLKTSDALGNPVIDPDTTPVTESGTQENPFSVAVGIAKQNTTDGWVKGYIVGCVKNGVSSVFSAADVFIGVTSGFNSSTNVLIADNAGETNYSNCIAVNLPSGSALRADVNLQDNPGNIGKTLNVKGTLRTYFGIAGSRDNGGNDFVLEGEGGSGGVTPGDDILNVPFTTDMGGFTTYSVIGNEVWDLSAQYGMLMSGFVGSQSYQNEDWLISPAMNLTEISSAVLTFDHARGPASAMNVPLSDFTLWISTDYTSGAPATAAWTQLTIPTHGTVAWGFVSSGNIAFPASVLGKTNVRFAFKYTCSNTESASWEIKNVIVK